MDRSAPGVDDGHMLGQHGRAGTGWVAGVAVLLAGVLLTAVGVAALRTDTASAETVLARGADAVVELPDGTSRPAVEGERVPLGATVRAGRTGAELHTRDREVHLGADTDVTVVDGVRQVLHAGFVLVDASDAPGLELRTIAGTVTSADDSLVRVDGGRLVRVGVLRGDDAAVRATDRRATTQVDTYFQVQVPRGGLPGAPTPFVLTPGDDYEAELASDLVAADRVLNALASRLDAEGAVGQVVLSSLRRQVAPAALSAGAPGSEQALGYLIATAAPGAADLAARYERVRALRADGGSWGVVAAIVDAEVGRVGAALNALLEPGTVPVVAGGTLDVGAALGLRPPGAVSVPGPDGPDSGSDGPDSDSDRDGSDDGNGGGGPSPTPSPSPGPTDPVEEAVTTVVDTIRELISPSPSASPLPLPLPLPVSVPVVPLQVSPTPLLPVTVPLDQ
jgi:hypothetical protein